MQMPRGIRKEYTSIVFLKESQIEAHFRNLEVKEGLFIVKQPKEASEETIKANHVKCIPHDMKVYEYTWRLATKKERNEAVRKNGGVFQSL
jgi:hypothetical protein